MVMRQHNIWYVCTCFLCEDVCRTAVRHTSCYLLYYNCNTVDNIYVKTCKLLGSQNEHSDIANKYSSNLKMTRVSRNMSL